MQATRDVHDAVDGALAPIGARGESVVLAISGGLDSTALLHAAAQRAPSAIALVATFDHGTGDAAQAAVELVARRARERGLPVRVGRATIAGRSEAAWREARWRFLRAAARDVGASRIVTAHTRDDQVETIVLRLLRDAGPRGLAGLYADTPDVLRPFVDVTRATLAAYADAHALHWFDDPTNRSLRHRRNRVRHELLPRLRAAAPALESALLDLSRRAAGWRRDVDAFVDAQVVMHRAANGAFHVATRSLAGYDAETLAMLWPAIAARGGVRLDRRGTMRLTAFTHAVAAGADNGTEIQLSGPVHVEATRGAIVFRTPNARQEAPGVCWRVERQEGERTTLGSLWEAWLPRGAAITTRAWEPGDRMRATAQQLPRRVKRFFSDAHVPARARIGWPVVLVDGEVVWIPGVRRSDAATDRPDRPGVHYRCERIDG